MGVTLTKDAFRLDRTFTPDELATYPKLIEERTGRGYYHQFVIEDAAGRRLETPGIHPGAKILPVLDRHGFPRDLTGKTVLDIGCNAGFYSLAARIRGATSVLGIDQVPHCLDQGRLIQQILGLEGVEFRHDDGHNLDEGLGIFDFVINTGVIYHLQNPMDFLGRMARVTRETMYLETETLVDPKYAEYAWFIEKTYFGDPSNWWVYGPRCVERMVRAAGFREVEFQGFVFTPPPGAKTPEGFDRQGRGAFVCRK
jgi:tRNA (mo5U34)-methyltransferase